MSKAAAALVQRARQQRHSNLVYIVCLFLIDLERLLSNGCGGQWIVHRVDLSKLFRVIDRWAGFTHTSQIYCFSPVLNVLSLFRVYTYNFRRIFIRHMARVDIF